MGVFSRLFSREGGAAHDTGAVRTGDASTSSPTAGALESESSEVGARNSFIEVPTSLLELTEDISSELVTAEPVPERDAHLTESTVRRSEHASRAEDAPVTRTVKRPPPVPPPAPRRPRSATPNLAAPPVHRQPIDEQLDQAIAALLDSDGAAPPAASEHASDRQALLETFSGLAKLYVQPLRELLFQLGNGPTPRTWADACRPLLAPLVHSATQIGLPELASGLNSLERALSLATEDSGALIGAVTRVHIQEAYARLGAILPEAFGAPRASDGRRTILLESLLLQVPGLHRRGIAKLYAAGVCSVVQLAQGTAQELSEATGIDRELAQQLVEHVQNFERERLGLDAARQRQKALGQLRSVADRLRQLQSDFERAEQTEDRAAKKAVRRAREAAVLNLQLLLAELAELELMEELKRCSVRAKLERIESYLQRAREQA